MATITITEKVFKYLDYTSKDRESNGTDNFKNLTFTEAIDGICQIANNSIKNLEERIDFCETLSQVEYLDNVNSYPNIIDISRRNRIMMMETYKNENEYNNSRKMVA